MGFGGRGGRTGRGAGCGRAAAGIRVEVADLAVVLVVVLVAPDLPDVVLVVFPVAVLVFAGVAILDEAALVLPVAVALVVPAADLAPVPVALVVPGVLVVPVVLAALVVLAVPVVLLGVADLALAGGVFGAEVREDTAEALPVVFLLISLDGVWATVLGVVVDFLPDAGLEVELVRADLGVSDGLRGGVFRSDMQITFPFELSYLIIVPCQPTRWKKR